MEMGLQVTDFGWVKSHHMGQCVRLNYLNKHFLQS